MIEMADRVPEDAPLYVEDIFKRQEGETLRDAVRRWVFGGEWLSARVIAEGLDCSPATATGVFTELLNEGYPFETRRAPGGEKFYRSTSTTPDPALVGQRSKEKEARPKPIGRPRKAVAKTTKAKKAPAEKKAPTPPPPPTLVFPTVDDALVVRTVSRVGDGVVVIATDGTTTWSMEIIGQAPGGAA